MIEQLQRRSALDPQNQTLQLNVVAAMAREGRSLELVAPLMDREAWNRAGAHAQNLAGIEVGRRIGSHYSFKGMRVWDCQNVSKRETFDTRTTISHRLATFAHAPTGIQFNLLPGQDDGLLKRIAVSRSRRKGKVRGEVLPKLPPFLIARGPVTNDQAWHTHPRNGLGEDGMYDTDAAKGPLPATGASFDEVKEYAESNDFSLPTAAQWEYACKAGSETRFYWGDEFDPSHVWFAGNSGEPSCGTCIAEPSINHPHPPKIISHAEHEAAGKWNAFGLVDMIGNVFEWVDPGHTYSSSYLYSRQLTEANFLYPNAQNSESLHDVGFRPIKTIDWSD